MFKALAKVNHWTAHPPPGCRARRPCPPDLTVKSYEKAADTHSDHDDKEQDGKLVMKCWKAVCRHNDGRPRHLIDCALESSQSCKKRHMWQIYFSEPNQRFFCAFQASFSTFAVNLLSSYQKPFYL